MSAVDDILATLPVEDLARQFGTDPASVRSAVSAALPALLGGVGANAQDPAGAESLAEALNQHTSPVDPTNVDVVDGQKIVGHIFGANSDQVVGRLAGLDGHPDDLMRKLIPLLAPIVLGYLAKQVGGSAGTSAGGGGLGAVLGEILTGAGQGTATRGGSDAGSILGDLLGGLLGAGRR